MMIFGERFSSPGAADVPPGHAGPVSAFICGCWAGIAPSLPKVLHPLLGASVTPSLKTNQTKPIS